MFYYLSMLAMEVGDIWYKDTTTIDAKWGKRETWLVIGIGTAVISGDLLVQYIHMESGTRQSARVYARNGVVDFTGNPYYKRLA